MARMSDAEIRQALKALPGWAYLGHAIHREWRFAGFRAAMSFVDRVAERAITAGHHPDIEIRYDRVMLSLTTHDDGGVSARDIALAMEIEEVVEPPGDASTGG